MSSIIAKNLEILPSADGGKQSLIDGGEIRPLEGRWYGLRARILSQGSVIQQVERFTQKLLLHGLFGDLLMVLILRSATLFLWNGIGLCHPRPCSPSKISYAISRSLSTGTPNHDDQALEILSS
jgi:hypothetical protein